MVFSENVIVKGKPRLKLSDGHSADCLSGNGSAMLTFQSPDKAAKPVSVDLNGGFTIATQASVSMRMAQLALPASSTAKQ